MSHHAGPLRVWFEERLRQVLAVETTRAGGVRAAVRVQRVAWTLFDVVTERHDRTLPGQWYEARGTERVWMPYDRRAMNAFAYEARAACREVLRSYCLSDQAPSTDEPWSNLAHEQNEQWLIREWGFTAEELDPPPSPEVTRLRAWDASRKP